MKIDLDTINSTIRLRAYAWWKTEMEREMEENGRSRKEEEMMKREEEVVYYQCILNRSKDRNSSEKEEEWNSKLQENQVTGWAINQQWTC